MLPAVLRVGEERFALTDRATGELLRAPGELTAVGRFVAGAAGGYVAPARAAGGSWGFVDHTGRWLMEPVLDDVRGFSEGLAAVKRDGLCGYVDVRGEFAIEPRFGKAAAFREGLAAVREGEAPTRYYVDVTGERAVPGDFWAAGHFSPVGLAPVRVTAGGPVGYADRAGRMVVEPRFEEALGFSAQGAAPARTGKKWGLAGCDGSWILSPRYRQIGAFTSDGLAYFAELDHWQDGGGYLDATGAVVLRGDRHLSSRMVCGVARTGLSMLSFAGPRGFEGRFLWAQDFSSAGATVALREDDVWGVLRADGTFLPVPHPEPVTDDEGWVLGFGSGHGIAPFLTEEHSLVYLDEHATPLATFASGPGGQELRSAAGGVVWRDGPGKRHYRFLSRRPEDLAETADDVLVVADRLQRADPAPFATYFMSYGFLTEEAGLEEWDDEDIFTGALAYLASAYVNDEIWGEYQFLDTRTAEAIQRAFDGHVARLAAHYGTPLEDVHGMRGSDAGATRSWLLPDGRLLTVEQDSNYGDGDFEYMIWLAVRER